MPAAQAAGIVMSGHIEGASRDQATSFPERLDELIAPDSMVRVVDAFVGTLDPAALGFAKALPARTGGGFDRSRFVCEAESDSLRCPAGRTLRFKSASAKNQARCYVCEGCTLKARCTKAPG